MQLLDNHISQGEGVCQERSYSSILILFSLFWIMALVFDIFSPYAILKRVVKDQSVSTADMKCSSLGLLEPCFGLYQWLLGNGILLFSFIWTKSYSRSSHEKGMLQRRIKNIMTESPQILGGINDLCLSLEKKIVTISSWYFSPVFTGEIIVSKNDNSCFTKRRHCARDHCLQPPAVLNSSYVSSLFVSW